MATAVERLRRVRAPSEPEVDAQDGSQTGSSSAIWREKLNMEVKTYQPEPVVFLMVFDNTMFSEQYHRGRPDKFVPVGSCIGKYKPVVQGKIGDRPRFK